MSCFNTQAPLANLPHILDSSHDSVHCTVSLASAYNLWVHSMDLTPGNPEKKHQILLKNYFTEITNINHIAFMFN